jgi:hypothetical protein
VGTGGGCIWVMDGGDSEVVAEVVAGGNCEVVDDPCKRGLIGQLGFCLLLQAAFILAMSLCLSLTTLETTVVLHFLSPGTLLKTT